MTAGKSVREFVGGNYPADNTVLSKQDASAWMMLQDDDLCPGEATLTGGASFSCTPQWLVTYAVRTDMTVNTLTRQFQ